MIKITIAGTPQSINRYIGRSNIWEYQKDKKDFSNLVKMQTIGFNPKYSKLKSIKVTYYFKDKRRRDPGNYDKFLLDALMDASIIMDDSYSVIGEYITKAEVDRNNPRVEIEFEI